MKLIVGLGNPGKECEKTRHNVGFMALDILAGKFDASWSEDKKRHALVAKVEIESEHALLAKPTTFMNSSGTAVQELLSYYKADPKNLLVIHDEMDLPAGRIAFLGNGGPAGHNGVTDIQEKLGSKAIPRLRIGIGRSPHGNGSEDWVLSAPRGEKAKAIKEAVHRAADAAIDWVALGPPRASNIWNVR